MSCILFCILNNTCYVTKMTWTVFSFFCYRKMPWFAFEINCLVPNSRHTFLNFFVSNRRRTFFDSIPTIKFRASHCWVLNSRQRTFFIFLSFELQAPLFYDTHHVISLDLKASVLNQDWDPPHSWGLFRYHSLRRGFSTKTSCFTIKPWAHMIPDSLLRL